MKIRKIVVTVIEHMQSFTNQEPENQTHPTQKKSVLKTNENVNKWIKVSFLLFLRTCDIETHQRVRRYNLLKINLILKKYERILKKHETFLIVSEKISSSPSSSLTALCAVKRIQSIPRSNI